MTMNLIFSKVYIYCKVLRSGRKTIKLNFDVSSKFLPERCRSKLHDRPGSKIKSSHWVFIYKSFNFLLEFIILRRWNVSELFYMAGQVSQRKLVCIESPVSLREFWSNTLRCVFNRSSLFRWSSVQVSKKIMKSESQVWMLESLANIMLAQVK